MHFNPDLSLPWDHSSLRTTPVISHPVHSECPRSLIGPYLCHNDVIIEHVTGNKDIHIQNMNYLCDDGDKRTPRNIRIRNTSEISLLHVSLFTKVMQMRKNTMDLFYSNCKYVIIMIIIINLQLIINSQS